MQKVNRSIRFNDDELKIAERLEIDINQICRDALKKEISHRLTPEYIAQQKKLKELVKKIK